VDSVENGAAASDAQPTPSQPNFPLPQRVYSLSERLPRNEPFGKGDPFGTQPAPAEPPEEKGPTFWDHISELRKRLLLSFVGIVVGGAIAYAFWQRLWTLLAYPLTKQHLHVDFIATSPLESFVTSLKLSLMAGLVLAFPWVMWQFWRFLAPALYQTEKSLFLGAFLGSVVMFIGGAAFAFGIVLPAGLHFLATYASGSVVQNWKQADYASFISQFLLAFGLIFELPMVIFVLAKLGLVTAAGLWSFFRFALILIFVVAAFLTPGPDPVSQVLLALPLCVLYLVSIGVAAWVQPKEKAA
jgi:sec-independent protein translocase protein TatC